MKIKVFALLMAMCVLLVFSGCSKDKDDPEDTSLTTAAALENYWQYQTDLTAAMEDRDGTMAQINTKIRALGAKSGKDAIEEIDALVETYAAQSDAIASQFELLIQAENAIIPYGSEKGFLGSLAKGIYSKAKDTVVSSGRMVRSGWRVLSGKQTISQVVHDPNSGIPIVSGWAETIQKRNSARDTLIKEAILSWNPITSPADHAWGIPYDELPGNTPQEKANAYLNLSDDSSMKMQTRSAVVNWADEERVASAMCVTELGETGVKAVGDAYGGGAGEWTNEVINQHMEEGQTTQSAGTLNVNVTQQGAGTPLITGGKTLVISKANMPEDDPRITVIMNAPPNLVQQLPQGEYNVIALADGFIRGIYENVQVVTSLTSTISTQLMNMAQNAIVIEDLTVDNGTITVNEPVTARVSCLSTIGKQLSFAWTVTGGTYTNSAPSGTNLTFNPTEEKEYIITVTVSDDLGNSKTRSVAITSLGSKLAIDDWNVA
ncbi:MAG: PKD domain-containing protein, partial [Candidatus Cloacimonetes bacterium]|nr:PKD domain-containing protein [Candidatus Cloacimonadota bacterium]